MDWTFEIYIVLCLLQISDPCFAHENKSVHNPIPSLGIHNGMKRNNEHNIPQEVKQSTHHSSNPQPVIIQAKPDLSGVLEHLAEETQFLRKQTPVTVNITYDGPPALDDVQLVNNLNGQLATASELNNREDGILKDLQKLNLTTQPSFNKPSKIRSLLGKNFEATKTRQFKVQKRDVNHHKYNIPALDFYNLPEDEMFKRSSRDQLQDTHVRSFLNKNFLWDNMDYQTDLENSRLNKQDVWSDRILKKRAQRAKLRDKNNNIGDLDDGKDNAGTADNRFSKKRAQRAKLRNRNNNIGDLDDGKDDAGTADDDNEDDDGSDDDVDKGEKEGVNDAGSADNRFSKKMAQRAKLRNRNNNVGNLDDGKDDAGTADNRFSKKMAQRAKLRNRNNNIEDLDDGKDDAGTADDRFSKKRGQSAKLKNRNNNIGDLDDGKDDAFTDDDDEDDDDDDEYDDDDDDDDDTDNDGSDDDVDKGEKEGVNVATSSRQDNDVVDKPNSKDDVEDTKSLNILSEETLFLHKKNPKTFKLKKKPRKKSKLKGGVTEDKPLVTLKKMLHNLVASKRKGAEKEKIKSDESGKKQEPKKPYIQYDDEDEEPKKSSRILKEYQEPYIPPANSETGIVANAVLWIGVGVGTAFSAIMFILCCSFYKCLFYYRSHLSPPLKSFLESYEDKSKQNSKAKTDDDSQYVISISDNKEKGLDWSSDEEEEVFDINAVKNHGASDEKNTGLSY